MLNHLRALLGVGATPAAGKPDQLQIAVAALMVQAAMMDDTFDLSERIAIERLLAERFGLGSDAVKELLALAEQRAEESTQLYAFTRVAIEQLNDAERVKVIEMLWEVAYADGVLDPDEDALLRRVAGLLYVSDYDRGEARNRVLRRIRIAEQSSEEEGN